MVSRCRRAEWVTDRKTPGFQGLCVFSLKKRLEPEDSQEALEERVAAGAMHFPTAGRGI